MAGKASAVGKKESLTLDEFYALYKRAGKTENVLNNYSNKYILNFMLQACLADFLDYGAASCDFDGEKLIGLVKFIIDLPLIEPRDPEKFMSMRDYYYADDIKNSSEYSLAVAESSECKKGAAEFIKYYLSDKIQTSETLSRDRLPVTVSALDLILSKAEKNYYYLQPSFNNSGIYTQYSISVTRYKNIGSYPGLEARYDELYTGMDALKFNFTEEDADMLRSFLNGSKVENKYEPNIYKIIWEELDIYLDGGQTLDKAASFIQNRVTTYIGERYR